VQAGQILMRMDMKLAEADAKTIGNDLGLRSLQLRRIDAELSGKPLSRKHDDSDDLFRQVSAQYRDHQQSFRDTLGQAREALKKSQREYDSAREVLSKLEQTTPILKQQADAYADMGKEGYMALLTARDKQREYLEKLQDQQAQKATVASLEAAINQVQKQVDQITSKYRSDLQNERIEAEGQHRKLQQDWVKQEYKNGLLELKASQTGIVNDLDTHTIGTVVSPGTVLLSIVPENEPLVAEVMVKNNDVGFVYLNQKVKLKLAAYPFEQYGMLDGFVSNIGPDSSEADPSTQSSRQSQDKQQAQTSNYKARIDLGSQTLEAEGKKMKLVPGMQVVAEINQGTRTVMRYLLSPVTKTLDESGHER
jgi:hemolysin D